MLDYMQLSKEVSYALRHAPWEYELELNDEGFVPVNQLLSAINEAGCYGRVVTAADLSRMVELSEKKRHEISGGKIRALYGHSLDKRITKEKAIPPDVLYHGTTPAALESILENGLHPMGRQYVHLSADTETALAVAKRRTGKPVLLIIESGKASQDGIAFYIGNEKVWLADNVPCEYIEVV